MFRLHPRILQTAIAVAMVAVVPGPALGQSTSGVSSMRCTLVGLKDFAAARLPTPDKIIVTAAPPDEECHAIYGTGQMAALITVALTRPFQGMPFSQSEQMCRSIKPPCEPVLGVGERAHYQRSGRATGYGSMQEVMASVHGRVQAVRAVGMTVPIAKSALITLARSVALRH